MKKQDHTPGNGEFRIGEWTIRPRLNMVEKEETSQRLEPKIMVALCLLAERADETITRDEFGQAVWPDTHVSEEALNRAISELRKVFEDDAQEPRYIETIRKVGYRLIAPVSGAVHYPLEKPASSGSIDAVNDGKRRSGRFSVIYSIVAILFLALIVWLSWQSLSTRADRAPRQRQPITSFRGLEFNASFSPHGNQVAFAWAGEKQDNLDIYLRLIDEETLFRLTDDPAADYLPSWSPDAQRIAFIRQQPDGRSAMFIKPALGGSEQRLIDLNGTEVESGPVWSPDGQFIAFNDVQAGTGRPKIMLYSLRGNQAPTVVDPNSEFADYEARFSPDGRLLAFVRKLNYNVEDIFAYNMANGEISRLTDEQQSLSGYDWTSDGDAFFVSSSKAGFRSIHHINLESGDSRWLSASGHHAKHPAVSRTDDKLIFEDWTYEINIWRMSRPDPDQKFQPGNLLIGSTQKDHAPHYSPDGTRIAFISSRGGTPELWISKADGSELKKIGAAFESGSLAWSPDGSDLAFTARIENLPGIWLLSLEDNTRNPLTDPGFSALFPTWSRDGGTLFFTSYRNGSWEIWRQSLASDKAEPISSNGGFVSQLSPDGKFLYISKPDQSTIWRLDPETGVEEMFLQGSSYESDRLWCVRQEGIYRVRYTGRQTADLILFQSADAEPRVLYSFEKLPVGDSFSFTPDGLAMVAARLDHRECDLIMLR